jgi:ribonucleotide monophosphatase NagD (HAD superfamily)
MHQRIISDLDGVVYRGDATIASAVRAFARMGAPHGPNRS